MRILSGEAAREVRAHGSEGVTFAPLTAPIAPGAAVQAAWFRLAPGGRIGSHPAVVPQLLVVVEGRGVVVGGDGVEREIAAGEAAYWDAGEVHETRSSDGLVAIVIEADGLRLRA